MSDAMPESLSDAQTTTHRHAPDWVVLLIACTAQFMVVLDVSIVNVALPSMQRSLHFTVSNAQWVVNAYVLTFAGFLLLGGRAADIFGRRRVYLTGLTIFTVASIGAGFAATGAQMIAVRALQGVGGAILSPATLTIIVTTFHGARMPKAIGAWSAVAGAGGAVGALLGGLLTGYASWRWVFFINVPFGIAAAVLAMMYLREMRNRDAAVKLDITGAVLVTGSLASLIYGVVNTTNYGWGSSSTLSWFFAGRDGRLLVLGTQGRVAPAGAVSYLSFSDALNGQYCHAPGRGSILRHVVLPDLLLPEHPWLRRDSNGLGLLAHGARDHRRGPTQFEDPAQDRGQATVAGGHVARMRGQHLCPHSGFR